MTKMTRRSFLVTTAGLVLGKLAVPALPKELKKTRLMMMPTTPEEDEYAIATWLEHSKGESLAMMFMANDNKDRVAIKRFLTTLKTPGFGLERLREAPSQSGEWVARLSLNGSALYLTTTDERLLFGARSDADIFDADPRKAAVVNYQQALMLSVRMMQDLEIEPDAVMYMEPVRRAAALAKPNDVGVVIVEYLPSLAPNQCTVGSETDFEPDWEPAYAWVEVDDDDSEG